MRLKQREYKELYSLKSKIKIYIKYVICEYSRTNSDAT